jgi:hypothetical protein
MGANLMPIHDGTASDRSIDLVLVGRCYRRDRIGDGACALIWLRSGKDSRCVPQLSSQKKAAI